MQISITVSFPYTCKFVFCIRANACVNCKSVVTYNIGFLIPDENGEWLTEEQKKSDAEEENVRVDESPEEEQLTGTEFCCFPVSYTHLDVYKRQG